MKTKTKIIISGIIVGVLILLMFLFFSSIKLSKLSALDISSSGHGEISQSSWSSFLVSLGISEGYDYVDDEGVGYCFDDVCWFNAEMEYEACLDGGEMVLLSSPNVDAVFNFLTIMPSVCAIADGGLEDVCEEAYQNTLMNDCTTECREEVYMWDGTPVTNLGEFAETAYPDFISRTSLNCESWLMGGNWVSTTTKVGCTDATFIMCDGESITDAKEVCEVIGKSWTCNFNEVYCEG